MAIKVRNNAVSIIPTSVSSTATSITVTSGDGSLFPILGTGDYFYATIVSVTGAYEIVKVTARADNVMTVVRAQEGTSAISFPANSRFEHRLTAGTLDDFREEGDEASDITFVPYKNISATNVQAAIQEEVDDLGASTGAALIGFAPTVDVTSTNVQAAIAEIGTRFGAAYQNKYTGNGSTVAYTLSSTPIGENNTQVYIDGIYQSKDNYTVSGTTLTFSTAPPLNSEIEVIVFETTSIGETSADLVTYTPAGLGAVNTTVRTKLRETVSVKDFGAVGDGVTDDTAAIQAAIDYVGSNGDIYYPEGVYLVTNFTRSLNVKHFGNFASWKVGASTIPIPLMGDKTWADYTVYVDVSGSNTANNGLSSSTGFADVQFAFDTLPTIIDHKITISVGNGTFTTNYLTGSTDKYVYPRNAIFFARGKKIASRTQRVSGSMVAGVVIKGQGISSTVFTTNSNFDYGFYIGEGQIALEDLQITGNSSTSTLALLVAHRNDTYVHCNNVQLNGNTKSNTTYGMYAESGGQIEFTGSAQVRNVSIGALVLGTADQISISDDIDIYDTDKCLLSKNGGAILVQNTNGTVTGGMKFYSASVNVIECFNGGVIELRGLNSDFRNGTFDESVTITGTVLVDNGTLTAVYTRFDGGITAYGSTLKLDSADFQNFIRLYSSSGILRGAKSYIESTSPTNDSATPLIEYPGSTFIVDSNCDISPSSGLKGWTRNEIDHSLNDNSVIPIYSTSTTYRLRGNSGAKTNCYFPSTFTDISGIRIPEGFTIDVYGDSWGLGFANSATQSIMDLTNAFSVGNSAGQYTGCRWMFISGKWRLVGLGQLR